MAITKLLAQQWAEENFPSTDAKFFKNNNMSTFALAWPKCV